MREKWLEKLNLPKEAFEKEIRDFGIKFTYSTNRMEGSTLTLKDTIKLLQLGITPERKPVQDVKEAENHMKAFLEVLKFRGIPSLETILDWHYKLFKDTKPKIAGKLRDYQVRIIGSRFVSPSPLEIYPMLRDFFKWLRKNWDEIHPVELAGLAHLKLVTIHPFGDGNGRISRLLMNCILWQKRYPLVIVPYRNRYSYYSALERSQIKENEFIFLSWFIKNYKKFVWV